jgi:hypothetical protein
VAPFEFDGSRDAAEHRQHAATRPRSYSSPAAAPAMRPGRVARDRCDGFDAGGRQPRCGGRPALARFALARGQCRLSRGPDDARAAADRAGDAARCAAGTAKREPRLPDPSGWLQFLRRSRLGGGAVDRGNRNRRRGARAHRCAHPGFSRPGLRLPPALPRRRHERDRNAPDCDLRRRGHAQPGPPAGLAAGAGRPWTPRTDHRPGTMDSDRTLCRGGLGGSDGYAGQSQSRRRSNGHLERTTREPDRLGPA